MTYRPAPGPQFVPLTSTSPKDCVAAVTANLIDRATVSTKRPNHAGIRKASGAPATRGLWMSESIKAAQAYGVTVTGYYGIGRNDLDDLLSSGRGVGLLIDCSVTRYTARRTNSYTGPHCVYANSRSLWPAGETCACELHTANAHEEFTIDDPGTTSTGFQQWSAGLVYRAMESYGGGRIYCLASPDTEGRSWTAVDDATLRDKPTYTGSKKVGQLVIGKAYKGGRTETGGDWQRADGSMGDGWVHVVNPANGRYAWAKGESLR